jgi:DNA-binding NarL/FixJ family response regulator
MATTKIAIVENDVFYAETLSLVLVSDEISVVDCFDSIEKALKSDILVGTDIFLLDIDLGEGKITGIEGILKLKEKFPLAQYMILTVFEDTEKVFEALKMGALGYIVKSSSPEKIQSAILELKEGGSPMSPNIARKVALSFFEPAKQNSENLDKLTSREKEILDYIAEGKIEKEVASILFLSPKTVKKHISNIYTKLHVNNRVEALNKFYGKK